MEGCCGLKTPSILCFEQGMGGRPWWSQTVAKKPSVSHLSEGGMVVPNGGLQWPKQTLCIAF